MLFLAIITSDVSLERMGKHSSIACSNTNLNSHLGNNYNGFSEKWESIFSRVEQYHSWVYTQKMCTHTTRKFVKLWS